MNFDLNVRSSACFLKDIHTVYNDYRSCFQWNFKSISLLIFVKLFSNSRSGFPNLFAPWSIADAKMMKFLAWSKTRKLPIHGGESGRGGNSFNRQSGESTQMRVIAATEITFLETHAELGMEYNKPGRNHSMYPEPKPIKPNIFPRKFVVFGGHRDSAWGWAEPDWVGT